MYSHFLLKAEQRVCLSLKGYALIMNPILFFQGSVAAESIYVGKNLLM